VVEALRAVDLRRPGGPLGEELPEHLPGEGDVLGAWKSVRQSARRARTVAASVVGIEGVGFKAR
jgi:hypothetical protein